MAEVNKVLDKIVVVHWRDANARGGWDTRGEYLKHEIAKVVTSGFLLKQDDKSITVVSTQCKDWADCNGAISIPIEWCSSIKVVARLPVDNRGPKGVNSSRRRKKRK